MVGWTFWCDALISTRRAEDGKFYARLARNRYDARSSEFEDNKRMSQPITPIEDKPGQLVRGHAARIENEKPAAKSLAVKPVVSVTGRAARPGTGNVHDAGERQLRAHGPEGAVRV
jgi:hypothetical protein